MTSTSPGVGQMPPTHLEPELGYGQLLNILWRRAPWFFLALLSSLGIAALASWLRSPVYQSSMQLLVEPNVSKSISLNAEKDIQQDSSTEVALDYVTQLNLMRSKQFVEQAITTYPDLCLSKETYKECTERFQEALTLTQVEENNIQTRIFEVVFVDGDDYRALKSLEALQRIYLAYNQEQQAKRLTEGLSLVNQQIDKLQQDLNNSQQALQAFRQAGGTIDPEKQSLEAATTLAELKQVSEEVQADYQEAEAQDSAIQQALAADPQQALMAAKLSQSGRYQTLLEALQTSELELSERLSVYTSNDPIAQDLQAQRDLQVDLLQQESQRLLGSKATLNEDELLSSGQLGESDLALVQEMIDVQIKLRGLAARAESLRQSQQILQQQLDKFPYLIAEYDRLQPDVETQRESLELLLQTRQELSNEIARGGFKWEVVESPSLGEKIAPKPVQDLALGAIAGIFLGGLLAYSRESLDTTVRTYEELKKQAALPLLGVLPEVSVAAPRFSFSRVQIEPTFSLSPELAIDDLSTENRSALTLVQWEPFREAVDLIYKNIQLVAASREAASLKSVMVTSAIEQEGKTSLAVGLALSAARSQQRVLLIDADMRNPTIHKQFGLSNQQGLTQQLTTETALNPIHIVLTEAQEAQIDVLPAGPISADPAQLLKSRRMRALATELESQYDLVVYDSSSLLGRVDALQVASLCSGVVVVSQLDRVTQDQLTQATAILNRVNALGIVANSGDGRRVHPISTISLPKKAMRDPASNGAAAYENATRR